MNNKLAAILWFAGATLWGTSAVFSSLTYKEMEERNVREPIVQEYDEKYMNNAKSNAILDGVLTGAYTIMGCLYLPSAKRREEDEKKDSPENI